MTPEDIREIREQLGVSQAELARRLGIDTSTVSRWERGEQSPNRRYEQQLRGFVMTSDHLSDIERVAITILSQAYPEHPILSEWIRALTADLGESRWFDHFAKTVEDDVLAQCKEDGFAVGDDRRSLSTMISDRIAHPRSDDYRPTRSRRMFAAFDEALLHLASSLVRYRREGRPTGDWHTDLGPVIVQTSLAAAIAEYVQSIQNIPADLLLLEV